MAKDLSIIKQQFDDIARAAEKAAASVSQFKVQMAQALMAKGGTMEGSFGAVERMMAGNIPQSGRIRVGGGKSVGLSGDLLKKIQDNLVIAQRSIADELVKGSTELATGIGGISQSTRVSSGKTVAELTKLQKETFDAYTRGLVLGAKEIQNTVNKVRVTSGATPDIERLSKTLQLPAFTGKPVALLNAQNPIYQESITKSTQQEIEQGSNDLIAKNKDNPYDDIAIKKIAEDFDAMYKRLWSEAELQLKQQTQKVTAKSARAFLSTGINKGGLIGSGQEINLNAIAGGQSHPFTNFGQTISSAGLQTNKGDILDWSTITAIADSNGKILWQKTVESYNERAKSGAEINAREGAPGIPGGGSANVLAGKIAKLQSTMKPEQFAKVTAEISKLNAGLEPLGRSVADIGGAKLTLLQNGLKRVDMQATDTANGVHKLTLYLDEANKMYTKSDLKGLLQSGPIPPTKSGAERTIGTFRTGQAFGLAAQKGFGEEALKSVKIEQPANIAEFKFAMSDADGIMQNLTVTVDKYGHALTRTSKRLLDFTHSLIKNIQEMFKWSIGVGLIYGTYSKLGQLITLAVENQTRLADVTVALGGAQRYTNEIMRDAINIANQVGESVDGVLESYTMAYRAVGNVADPIKRTTQANKLLTDATILNKLSSLDAAEAIDVLSGSLRQAETYFERIDDVALEAGDAFNYGSEMLDKWVKVQNIANVDLATLSTAFSITAESALNAGVSVDELNAVIAVLSEKIGGLGGKETGNAVKALIGGVYQEGAAKSLQQLGIGVQDLDGRMRSFLDISRDIYELYNQGIIDETQLNKLAYTLGGGVRRGQQYVAFLKDQQRIQEIVNEQQDAQGSTAKA